MLSSDSEACTDTAACQGIAGQNKDEEEETEMITDDDSGSSPRKQGPFAPGTRVEVEFNSKWYKASILRARLQKQGPRAGEHVFDVDYGRGEAEDRVPIDRMHIL